MKIQHDLMREIGSIGQTRSTRSGNVLGVFKRDIVHDMRTGLPFPMTKKLMFKAMMGELIVFINGEHTLRDLRHRSNLKDDAWTIWTNDCERWHSEETRYDDGGNILPKDDLGKFYGTQWRNFGETSDKYGVDQLQDLINNMMTAETSRYHLVQAYNPSDVADNSAALPPCHTGFQVYIDVDTGEFDLDWTQRSVDVFLGLPFNIASYGMLMLIIHELTGFKPRYLYGSLKDTHLYVAHLDAVREQLSREIRPCTATVKLPYIESLDSFKSLTAEDFVLTGYDPDSPIKAPLLVGR